MEIFQNYEIMYDNRDNDDVYAMKWKELSYL